MSDSLWPHESQHTRPPCPSPTLGVHSDSCPLSQWCHPAISSAGYCFCFGSIPSFFLELFLHWSPVAYWAPTNLGSSSFSTLSFCFFILFMGFSRQEYWSGLPFHSPVDHILSDLSTMTCPSWVTPRAWLGFIELDKAVVLVWLDWLVFCDYGFSVSAFWCPLATPTYLGFSYLGCGVSLHSCFSKAQPLLLTLDERYPLTAAPPDLERGVDPLGPPALLQPAHFCRMVGHVTLPLLKFWVRDGYLPGWSILELEGTQRIVQLNTLIFR